MDKKKKRGFTLVELLATIVVLALIMGLSVYVAIRLVKNSKDNSYQVTINNIEGIASEYLIENSNRLFFVTLDDTYEYQCVTVKNLIDTGFFNSNILDSYVNSDDKVRENDYIYVKRNRATKAITDIKYGESDGLCDRAVKALGDVNIQISPSGYSADKEITITYSIKNANNINDYTYEYSYSDEDVSVISNELMVKKIRVVNNGTVSGYIRYRNSEVITEVSKEITNIDKTPPEISTSNATKVYGEVFDLFDGVTITDNSGEIDSKKVYLGDKEITSYKELAIGDNTLKYVVSDKSGNQSEKNRVIKLVVATKEFNYKESVQTYTVTVDGTYIIEAYGAQGGNNGGLGGYVKAEIDLKKGDTLSIITGGINGYNGGGGYKNSNYYPGGGATNVSYSNSTIVIAGGGGAKGSSGTGGAGGSGNGAGGADVGSGSGINGSNGGGGSNSLNYNYSCNCQTCGGGCYDATYRCCKWLCTQSGREYYCDTACFTCGSWQCNPTYPCNCQTCTKSGNSGTGGASSVISPARLITNTNGNRQSNGYVKVSYKV